MSNRLLQVACVSACILTTPRVMHSLQASQQVAGDAGGRIVGTWQGVLASGAFRERMSFVIGRDSTGGLRGTIKMLDQGGVELPAAVATHGDTLSFTIAAQHISYSGMMTSAGDSVRGTFVQGSNSIPLSFGRSTR